ncbi:HAD family hydrolase [Clostridium cibarium]|uniref:HAD-IA family hydrolase n=1 Tax=Clostridium cibarium TaxID=2762247 RepID=A0ABR8PVX4_9CLOT|nr:HAD-IA family hydrolase [Clostridium cibarium]MBD7912341.1 HAD-IA family hydrolase [Clostridium cibarium]
MNKYKKIKAILIDSGRVLNYPRSGNWFMSPNFYEIIEREKFNKIKAYRKRKAVYEGMKYLDKQTLILREEDEYNCFYKFFDIISDYLPELDLTYTEITKLTKDLVYNYKKYEFYDDVYRVIPKLSENIKLALVSDAWPSIEGVYKHANLRNYFSSFIISSKLGVSKPNKLMYQTALNELKMKAEEVVFIDDNPKNCYGAKTLGIKAVLLNRDFLVRIKNKIATRGKYDSFANLDELLKKMKAD